MTTNPYIQQNPQHPGQPQFREDEGIDFKKYLFLFLSNWYWFVAAMFIAIVVAYGINRYTPRQYTVSSKLMIRDDNQMFNNAEGYLSGLDLYKSPQSLVNELEILRSFQLHYEVVSELPDFWTTYIGVGRRGIVEGILYKDCPFWVDYDTSFNQRLGLPVHIHILSEDSYRLEIDDNHDVSKELRFGEEYVGDMFKFRIRKHNKATSIYDPESSNHYYFRFEGLIGLANRFRSKLAINRNDPESGSVVTLSMTSTEPRQAADYLNKLMEVYIRQGLDLKNATADSTIAFIDDQLGLVGDSLSSAEGELERFRLNNRLVDLSSEGRMIQDRLEQLDMDKANLNSRLQYYQYLKEYLEGKRTGEIVAPAVMGIMDPILSQMIAKLTELQTQKLEQSFSLVDELPSMDLMEQQMEEARKALAENVKSNLSTTQQAINTLNGRIQEVEKQISKLPGTERRLIRIERNFEVNNAVYTFLLNKRAEAGIARASNVADNRIIERALTFNAYSIGPKVRNNYMMAVLLALIIPAAFIFILDQLNNKVMDQKEVEKHTTIPILGMVGHSKGQSIIEVHNNPSSSLAESFRQIRTGLGYLNSEKETKVISVTSAIAGEGKTFSSLNLAAIFAMMGKKTVILGLDLRKPKLHKVFSSNNQRGVSTILIGRDNIADSIETTEVESLHFLPSGPVPPNPAELLESKAMKTLLEDLKGIFDLVVFDTPPLSLVTDALILQKMADITLFIVRQNYSTINTLKMIQDHIDRGMLENGGKGIIMNDMKTYGYYGYGLRYTYRYQSKYYQYNQYYSNTY